jgi:predicted nucleic acid-binding protein
VGTLLLTPSGSTMTTPKQVLIDTNVLVALVDARDTWHASAQAVREALKTTAVSVVYCDAVLNEAISVLGRRAQEQRRRRPIRWPR